MQKEKPKEGSDEDDYDNNDFEDPAAGGEDDRLEKLRKALDKENQKAVKHAQVKPPSMPSLNNPLVGGVGSHAGGGPKMQLGSVLGSNHPLGASNLDSFAKAKGLIIGEKVDHVAANQ